MLNRRWWDVAVAAGSVVIAAAMLMEFGPREPWRLAIGVAAIALFALGYVAIGRAAIGTEPGWRFPVFVAIAAVAVGVGSAASGFLAMMQALAYPLAWVIGGSRRRGIIASAVIASAVAGGIAVGGGLDGGSIVTGLATGAFSLAFSVAFGLWVAGIAEFGEERARLVAELTEAQTALEALSRDRGAAAERERLARDIHDTLAQTLAGLVIFAERAGRQSREGRADAAAATIATVEQVARDALAEARALVARAA
ncbi:histidine kinase, partial [Microbacterium sp. CPCC 204701]|uniref:histidine kinase n=1 Tax=Microbacterium sp. CPCC 204701 TaxID=2493084 RepID=UPI001F0C7E45